MTESRAFEWAAAEMEPVFGMSRLETRGTLRLALKEAGIEPRLVNARQLAVVMERILPRLLRARRIAEPDPACTSLALRLREMRFDDSMSNSAEDIFRRLARR